MMERHIDPYYNQLKWLQKRKSIIWQTPVNEIVHVNKSMLRALFTKLATTTEDNPNVRLFSITAAEKVISNCEELCDATRFLVRNCFREAVMAPA